MKKHFTLRYFLLLLLVGVLGESWGQVKKRICFLLILLFMICNANGQIAAWEFNGNAGNEVTVSATTLNANLLGTSVSRGAGLSASALGNSYSSTNFTMAGDLVDAIATGKYVQFTISAKANFATSLSTLDVNFRRSSSGPNTFQWQYSLDGFATSGNNIGSPIFYNLTTTNGDAQTQINLGAIPALQKVVNPAVITFRLYGYGATATTGTFALGRLAGNDLSIGGTVIPINSYIWNNGNCSWINATWVPSSYPGNTVGNIELARFHTNMLSFPSVGINMNSVGGLFELGGIEITNSYAGPAFNIGNNSGTSSGILRLNGTSINSVANAVIRNASIFDFTINDKSAGGICNNSTGGITMGVNLNNPTNNIISVEGTGGVILNSVISGSNPITKNGAGAGVLNLTAVNTCTGLATVNAGTLQLSNGTTFPVTNSIVVNGGTLQISASQTLANITLKSGATLLIDNTRTLTITGILTVDCNSTVTAVGTGKIAYNTGSSLIYSGTGPLTTGAEWPTTSAPPTVTINSGATVVLGATRSAGATATLNVNGTFNAAAFQVPGLTSLNVSGTVITTKPEGFYGPSTTFTSGTLSLGAASTINFAATSGNQVINGAVNYANLTASGGATKIPSSGTAVSGILSVLDDGTVLDGSTWSLGGTTTSLVMTGSSYYKVTGAGSKPDAGGTSYTLSAGSTIEFTGSSATLIRVGSPTPSYGNIIVSGSNVSLSSNLASIKMQGSTTFSVTSTGIFNVQSSTGFTGAAAAAVSNTNAPTIDLQAGSTINYNYAGNQPLTGRTDYKNLTISGSGVKAADGDVTVANTITLTAGELGINGKTLTANGAFSYGSGTLTGSSASLLTLGGTAGTLKFTPTPTAAHSLKDLTLSVNTASATLGSDLDIYGNVKLNDGTLALASQHLTLKSNSTNTATIDKLLADGSNLTGATNVTVERWIPVTNPAALPVPTGRRYQLLTPTVTTSSSIQANWMEGGQVTSVGGSSNPVSNYGTHITGSSNLANHFDRTQTDQPSLFTTTNAVIPTYAPFANTNGTLNALTGYFLFVRGDRSVSLSLFNTNQAAYSWVNLPSTNTTLHATGTIQKGAVTAFTNAFAGSGAWNLITNPYPAPIDWSLVSRTNVNGSYKYWDPHNGNRGGFVDVDNTGLSTPSSTATQYIQPGQAFFVIASGAGTPTISMAESNKAVGNDNSPVFLIPPQNFSASLFYYEGGVNRRLADGVRAIYDNAYSAAFDGAEDAVDLPNWDENMAIPRDGYNLVVDKRPIITGRDTMPLLINNLKPANYELEFNGQSFYNDAIIATLIDNFTGTRTAMGISGTTVVPITVSSNPASAASNRFMVVFENSAGPLPIDLSSVKAYEKNAGIQVDWVMNSEQDMDKYEVEKSADGRNFAKATTVASRGNSSVQVNYGWFDANPIFGDNFYRIKSIDKSGQYKNSNIVRVNLGKGAGAGISMYPNPFEGTGFNLQMDKLPADKYSLTMYNNLGQRVYSGTVTHSGGSATQYIELGKDLAAGTYTVKISGGGTELTRTITKK